MTSTRISGITSELRRTYKQLKAPIDLSPILKNEGIEAITQDLSNLEEKCNRKISGLIFVDDTSKTIYINGTEILARQRFTLAHELGHYFLHIKGAQKPGSNIIVSFRGERSQREREADCFAAELLMPEELVRKKFDETIFPTANEFAEFFGVSISAMRYRLNEMGLHYIG